jgi:hypothetical protein
MADHGFDLWSLAIRYLLPVKAAIDGFYDLPFCLRSTADKPRLDLLNAAAAVASLSYR